MYAARLVIVLLLILAVIVVSTPQARHEMMGVWEQIRPVAVNMMDNLSVALQNFVNSMGSTNRTHDVPVPAPSSNFERIVTLRSDFSM